MSAGVLVIGGPNDGDLPIVTITWKVGDDGVPEAEGHVFPENAPEGQHWPEIVRDAQMLLGHAVDKLVEGDYQHVHDVEGS